MKNCNIAILGATGAVGREMLNVLEEYDIPVSRLKLLSSARSAGSKILFRGEDLTVEEATDASFEGMDFVLGAVKSGMSRAFAPAIVKSGAVYIDNSSAFRMDPAIPLVVPEINGEDAKSNSGIIANPNCSTIITAMAVGALNRLSPIESMVACTYQAVSWRRTRADLRNSSARWTRSPAVKSARRRYSPRRLRSTSSRSSAACSIISIPMKK